MTVTLELVPLGDTQPGFFDRVKVECSEAEWSALFRSGVWEGRKIIAVILPGTPPKQDARLNFC